MKTALLLLLFFSTNILHAQLLGEKWTHYGKSHGAMLYFDSDSSGIWAAFQNKGIIHFDKTSGEYKCYDTLAGIADPVLNSVNISPHGVWAGSEQGLFRYNKNGWQLYRFKTDDGQEAYRVSTLYSDCKGRTWAIVRSNNDQILVMYDGSEWDQYDKSDWQGDIILEKIFAVPDGDVFISASNNGNIPGNYIFQYSKDGLRLWTEAEGIVPASDNEYPISSLAADSNGKIVIANQNGYSTYIKGIGWEYKKNWGGTYTKDNKDSLHYNIKNVKFSPNGDLWATTHSCLSGSYYLNSPAIMRCRDDKWELFNCFGPWVTDETSILIIDFDFIDNNIRFFTSIGIFDYNPDNGDFQQLELPIGTYLGFIGNQYHLKHYYDFIKCHTNGNFSVNFLRPSLWEYEKGEWKEYEYLDEPKFTNFNDFTEINGTAWFANKQGAGLMAYTDNKWKTFEMQDGLPDNNISCIEPGRDGSLWAAHYLGYTSNIVADSIISYDLRLSEYDRTYFDQMAIDSSGHVWVCGSAGNFSNDFLVIKKNIVYQYTGDEWILHDSPGDTAFGMCISGYKAMSVDRYNTLYLATIPPFCNEDTPHNYCGGLYTRTANEWNSYGLYRQDVVLDEPFCYGITCYMDTLVLAGRNGLFMFSNGAHTIFYDKFPINESFQLGCLLNTSYPTVLYDGTLCFRAAFQEGNRYVFNKDGRWRSRKDIMAPNGIFQANDASVWFHSGSEIIRIEEMETIDVAGQEELNQNSAVCLYPQPASDIIYIDISEQLQNMPVDIILYNALGMQVMDYQCVAEGQSTVSIDLSGLDSGVYLMQIITGDNISSQRVIISK